MNKVFYDTNFSLKNDVEKFDLAREFLQQDDMTDYIPERFEGVVVKVEWILLDCNSGVIEVQANRELNVEELEEFSEWIRGQNSDGLGESFEQQGFEGDDYEEDDYGNYCDMAEFDWATNKYPLKKKN